MTDTPPILILTHARTGDLSQMIETARATGLPFEVRRVQAAATKAQARARDPELFARPAAAVVMFAERKLAGLALALKAAGAGATRLVSVNRPGRRSGDFDLIVTAPQYRLAPASNVLVLPLALHSLDRDALRRAAEELAPSLADLPRPFRVALVGGASGPEMLGESEAVALARALGERVKRFGGSALVVSSPRTSAAATRALGAVSTGGAGRLFPWSATAPDTCYPALLELADEFVVTSDSASMATEAILTGKPVYVYRLPRRCTLKHRAVEAMHRLAFSLPPVRTLFDRGWLEASADRRLLFDPLEARGAVRTFSVDAPAFVPTPMTSPVTQAAAAVRNLMR